MPRANEPQQRKGPIRRAELCRRRRLFGSLGLGLGRHLGLLDALHRASRTALSVHFDVPPKEFIFLFRKLLGAYTFLHVIKAQVRGNTILEPFIHMREDEDRERVAQKINGQAADS